MLSDPSRTHALTTRQPRDARLPGTDGQGREVVPFRAHHTGKGAHTLAQQATVYLYDRGYRITDAGEVRNPTGGLVATPRRGKRGFRYLNGYAPLPEGHPRRGPRSGKGLVVISLGTFAAYCRYGFRAFDPGACLVYLDGDHGNLSRGNTTLSDRSGVSSQRERERRPWRSSWRQPVARPAYNAPVPPQRRKMAYTAVLEYRRRWNGGTGERIASLAREARVTQRAMANAVRGVTYRQPEEGRRTPAQRRGRMDDTTIRGFRYAVQELGVTVAEAAARLGKTARWGYYVMAGKMYSAVRVGTHPQVVQP